MQEMASEKVAELEKLSINDIQERMEKMRKMLLTLEWDKSLNQINPGMEARLTELRTEWTYMQGRFKELSVQKPG